MPNQTTIIRFDGNYFSYTDSSGNLVRIPAISGTTNSQNSQFQNVVDKGPLPEGSYDVKQSEYNDLNDSIGDKLKNYGTELYSSIFGQASRTDSWGTERVWLTPQVGTETYGRDGFTIHGGISAGSAGCIDLVDNAPTFFDFFKSLGSDAVLQVDYGAGYNGSSNPLTQGNSNITIEKIYSNQGKDLNEIKPIQNFLSASKNALEEKLQMSISEKSVTELLNDYKIKSGNSLSKLQNNEMINLDEATKTKIENSVITFKTQDGSEFSLVKDILIPLKDGTLVAVNTVINTIDSASSSLISFINHQIEGIFEPIFKELFSTDESTKDANGDNSAQRLAGKILADLIQGKDITQIANDTTSQILIQNLLKDTSEKLASVIPIGPLKVDTAKFVQGTVAATIINFAIAIAADHKMDSDEYGTESANQNFSNHPKLNFNDNHKYQKKLVANDNYKNIFILSLIKNA